MSKYHDVVTWQSTNGTWSVGFYERMSGGFNDDGDDEWGDEFNQNEFEYAKGGYRSEDEALRYAPYPNPGGYTSYPLDRATDADRAEFDEMKWAYNNPEEAAKKHEQQDLDWRKKNLLDSTIPPLDTTVTIKEWDKHGSGISYSGRLRKDDKGGLFIEVLESSMKTKKKPLFTPTGRVANGNKVSSIERQFKLPTYGMRSGASQTKAHACGRPTPKGPCTRTTYDYACWQHA